LSFDGDLLLFCDFDSVRDLSLDRLRDRLLDLDRDLERLRRLLSGDLDLERDLDLLNPLLDPKGLDLQSLLMCPIRPQL